MISRYYFRLEARDQPGVLAEIASILGENQISIESFIQKNVNDSKGTAELVIMTHQAKEEAFQKALAEIEGLAVVINLGNMIRVEG